MYNSSFLLAHGGGLVFGLASLCLLLLLIILSLLFLTSWSLLSITDYKEQSSVYECGFDAKESSLTLFFSPTFYFVALSFVLFDIELIFIVPWVYSLGDIYYVFYLYDGVFDILPDVSYAQMYPLETKFCLYFVSGFIFLLILLVGLYYEYRSCLSISKLPVSNVYNGRWGYAVNLLFTDFQEYQRSAWFFIMVLGFFITIFVSAAVSTVFERQVLAAAQRRQGPNYNGYNGFLQPILDGLKLLLKTFILPKQVNTYVFLVAPGLGLFLNTLCWAFLPVNSGLSIYDSDFTLLYVFALSSLTIYTTLLSGWASASKYALYASIRSVIQIISYELVMFSAVIPLILFSGSLQFSSIQEYYNVCEIVMLFPLQVCFFIAILAESNRIPFDLAEAEAELVAGYNTEYSAFYFALFFLSEYVSLLFWSHTLFFLFLSSVYFWCKSSSIFWLICLSFMTTLIFFLIVWIRATLPRYRYDDLLLLCWYYLLPILFYIIIFTVIIKIGSLWIRDFMFCFYGVGDYTEFKWAGVLFESDTAVIGLCSYFLIFLGNVLYVGVKNMITMIYFKRRLRLLYFFGLIICLYNLLDLYSYCSIYLVFSCTEFIMLNDNILFISIVDDWAMLLTFISVVFKKYYNKLISTGQFTKQKFDGIVISIKLYLFAKDAIWKWLPLNIICQILSYGQVFGKTVWNNLFVYWCHCIKQGWLRTFFSILFQLFVLFFIWYIPELVHQFNFVIWFLLIMLVLIVVIPVGSVMMALLVFASRLSHVQSSQIFSEITVFVSFCMCYLTACMFSEYVLLGGNFSFVMINPIALNCVWYHSATFHITGYTILFMAMVWLFAFILFLYFRVAFQLSAICWVTLLLLTVSSCLLLTTNSLLLMIVLLELYAICIYVLILFFNLSTNSLLLSLKYLVINIFSTFWLFVGLLGCYYGTGCFIITDLSVYTIVYVSVESHVQAQQMLVFGAISLLLGLVSKLFLLPFQLWYINIYINVPLPLLLYNLIIPKMAIFGFLSMFAMQTHLLELNAMVGVIYIILLAGALFSVYGCFVIHIRLLLIISSCVGSCYLFVFLALAATTGMWHYFIMYVVGYFFVVISWSIGLISCVRTFNIGSLLFIQTGEFKNCSELSKNSSLYHKLFLSLHTLSLLGVPPFIGFAIKFIFMFSFASINQTPLFIWFLLTTTAVSSVYYMRILYFIWHKWIPSEESNLKVGSTNSQPCFDSPKALLRRSMLFGVRSSIILHAFWSFLYLFTFVVFGYIFIFI